MAEQSGIFGLVERVRRSDSWALIESAIDELSGAARGRGMFVPEAPLTPERWAATVRHDPAAAELADKIVRHGIRFGWDLRVASVSPVQAMQLRDLYQFEEERLDVARHMRIGAFWGRVQGFAATWLGVDDGDPAAPLDLGRAKALRWLHTVPASHVTVQALDVDRDPKSERYLRPTHYRIRLTQKGPDTRPSNDPGGARVHWSRLVLWPGNELVDPDLLAEWWRDDSALEVAREALEVAGRNHAASANLLRRVSQVVVKFRNLAEIVGIGKTAELRERIRLLERGRDVDRILPLDREEEIATVNQPIAGVGEVHQISDRRLASSSAIPRTVFVGESPTDQDNEAWDAEVMGWQRMVLRPRHEMIARAIIAAAKLTTGSADAWSIEYRPVRPLSAEKRATVRKTHAEADQIEINAGVVAPESVALARHSGLGSADVILAPEEIEARIKRRTDLAAEPPKDNAQLGTVAARAGGGQSAIVEMVHAGRIPRESGIEILVQTFQLLPEKAAAMLPAPPAKDVVETTVPGAEGVAGASAVQDTALNGAQVAELRTVLEAVKAGTMAQAAAVDLIAVAFPTVERSIAERMVAAQVAERAKTPPPDAGSPPAGGAAPPARPVDAGERGPIPGPGKGVGAGAPQGAPNANAGGAPNTPDTIKPTPKSE